MTRAVVWSRHNKRLSVSNLTSSSSSGSRLRRKFCLSTLFPASRVGSTLGSPRGLYCHSEYMAMALLSNSSIAKFKAPPLKYKNCIRADILSSARFGLFLEGLQLGSLGGILMLHLFDNALLTFSIPSSAFDGVEGCSIG